MLYQLKHGTTITQAPATRGGSARSSRGDYAPLEQVARLARRRSAGPVQDYAPLPNPDPVPQPGLAPREAFRFLCKDAAVSPEVADVTARIEALAMAMSEAQNDQKDEAGESDVTPIMTYFGQFIDHDITANTDRDDPSDPETAKFSIDADSIAPQPRDKAEEVKLNLRTGALELDSVYGDGPDQSPVVARLEAAMRSPADPAKMRIGAVTPVSDGSLGNTRPDLPTDPGADLPRIGAALDDGSISMEDVRALFDPAGTRPEDDLRRIALIGDGRNDENLIVAQLHLAFLRLHNAIVDRLRADGFAGDDDALFREARRQVTMIYQWLVVHVFCKAVCDAAVVDEVIAAQAPVYRAFFERHKDDMPEGVRPMPLEFSVAAFRFGHSMIRGDYDYNRSFGRLPDGSGERRSSFDLLFRFTGGGGFFGLPTLPDNWIIEWDRFEGTAPMSNRVARKIDTKLARPLLDMFKEQGSPMMKRLAERNLRRGYVFNLPSGQSMVACLAAQGVCIEPLTEAELTSGDHPDIAAALTDAGFVQDTPLWFYVLKEAEVRGKGNRLGPLGSRIVAETLIGLLVTDPRSFIRQGAFDSWTPAQAVQPLGVPIVSFAAMMQAAGVMAAPQPEVAGGARVLRPEPA